MGAVNNQRTTASFASPSPAAYRVAMAALPPGTLEREHLLTNQFLLARENHLSVFYGPFHALNRNARIVLVGLTPGWKEMRLAFEAARAAICVGHSDHEVSRAAKATASFAGMRKRLGRWLDELGVATWLGIESALQLFDEHRGLLHITSLIRYPVFTGEVFANYRGVQPRPEDSLLLSSIVTSTLAPELAELTDALVVPMGTAVSRAFKALIPGMGNCIYGFPHPSGANGWANRQFEERRAVMKLLVAQHFACQ